MPVDPTETAAHVRERLRDEALRAAIHARTARAAAEAITRALVERYSARRVVLFGSLARGHVHAGSDIDLAVVGLDPVRLAEAAVALDELAAPCTFDLVAFDRLAEPQRRRIERSGIRLA